MLDFQPHSDIRHEQDGRVVISIHQQYFIPQGNSLVLISIKRWSEPKSYSIQALGICHLKISTDPTRNRNQNLASWGTVTQSTALFSKGNSPVFWFSPVSINPYSFQLYIQFQQITASLHDKVNLSQHRSQSKPKFKLGIPWV